MTVFSHAQDKIWVLMGPAIENLFKGKVNGFVHFFEYFLETRAMRSLETANEVVLQGIVEVLLDESKSHVSELCLMVDGTKNKGEGCFGFVDMFLPPKISPKYGKTLGVVLELKDITLLGLLRSLVIKENTNELMTRKYIHWLKEQKKSVLMTFDAVMKDSVKQLETYLETIAIFP
ncbi:hypothetical protein G9A89_007890 [Geosiphon pyriformis]|nr:hypothetical protein G9A89_007890 [Geosiphon pyriformis]